jgi:hypothetical protein
VSDFKAKAIILASGPGDVSVREEVIALIEATLKPFTLIVLQNQSIALAGRIIIAFEIGLDEAHAKAIEKDLINSLKAKDFDIALDLI